MKIAMKIFAVFAVFAVGASARVLLDDSCATADCCNEKISIFGGGLNWESDDWCTNHMPCRDVAGTLFEWGAAKCCELRVINKKFNVSDDAKFCPGRISSWPCSGDMSEITRCCKNKILSDDYTGGDAVCDGFRCNDWFHSDDGLGQCCYERLHQNVTDSWCEDNMSRLFPDYGDGVGGRG